MKLFEHQAKELFQEAGIPIPEGKLVSSVSGLDGVAEEVGLPCAIKAQVLQGGRGKAGLIQLASTSDEVRAKSEHHPRARVGLGIDHGQRRGRGGYRGGRSAYT
jgi:succinyl-CoA synthetase beta subunit